MGALNDLSADVQADRALPVAELQMLKKPALKPLEGQVFGQ